VLNVEHDRPMIATFKFGTTLPDDYAIRVIGLDRAEGSATCHKHARDIQAAPSTPRNGANPITSSPPSPGSSHLLVTDHAFPLQPTGPVTRLMLSTAAATHRAFQRDGPFGTGHSRHPHACSANRYTAESHPSKQLLVPARATRLRFSSPSSTNPPRPRRVASPQT